MFAQGDYGLRPAIDLPHVARAAAAGLRDILAQRRARAQVVRELTGYTDRELADIGISRADIPDVAAGCVTR